MNHQAPPIQDGPEPRFVRGTLEIPVWHARGGTSTGIVLLDRHLPRSTALREEIIRNIMGVPLSGEMSGNRQITGLGRGITTSNKVFILAASARAGFDLESTLAQLAADKAAIDWSVNCGNMSAALPLVAFETGLAAPRPGRNRIRIHNTNTGIAADAAIEMPEPDAPLSPDTEMPGVPGRWPGVALSLVDPVGSKTGKLFPTGARRETFGSVEASCVDFAMPMVIVRAGDLGCRADEAPEALESDETLRAKLQPLWVAAGLAMGLERDGRRMTAEELAVSETVPKVCLIAPPDAAEAAHGAHVRARYFTPQTCHRSMAVTGGSCLAAASLIPGTVAHETAAGLQGLGPAPADREVGIGNPAGVLRAVIRGSLDGGEAALLSAAYIRSAQILIRGYTPIYHASRELIDHYRAASRCGSAAGRDIGERGPGRDAPAPALA